MNNKHSYKDRRYEIVPYNPDWTNKFEEYKSKIKKIFPNFQIEHIGSTSVLGMAGKPCIDILVIVDDIKTVEGNVREMEQAGFEYAGQFVMENSRLFRVMKDNSLLANIHFFPIGHPHNDEMINLRNYLRAHPQEAENYSKIKENLYSKYENDYASYRKYKDEYMNELKKRVQKKIATS
jgi:GrpB-like predicted nucleotidyltransferase (UPF0157 family)